MVKKTYYFIVFVLISCFSCITTFRIDRREYLYFPYFENDRIVFCSNDGRVDTLHLTQFSEWSKPNPYPYLFNRQRFEQFGYRFSHSINSEQKILPDFYIALKAFNWKGTRIEIGAESDNDINGIHLTLNEYDSLPHQKFNSKTKEYSDVIKIESIENEDNIEFKIEYLYWSKSKGIIGWEDEKTEWKLIE